MSTEGSKIEKLYYSISEVSDMFGVNQSNLRFWEKEFDIIQPRKNSKGTRFYTKEDIENIKLIYQLVRRQGMTLEGARKKLKDDRDQVKKNTEIVERLLKIKQEIADIKREL